MKKIWIVTTGVSFTLQSVHDSIHSAMIWVVRRYEELYQIDPVDVAFRPYSGKPNFYMVNAPNCALAFDIGEYDIHTVEVLS